MAVEFTRGSDFELHPAGEVKAQFVEWAEDKHEQFGIQVKLTFDTARPMEDGRPFRISTWAKPSLHKKSKISKMMAAFGLDTEKLTEDEVKNFDLDEYIGKRLRLVITHEPKKDSKDLTHRITAFLPYRQAEVKTVAAFADDDETPETSGDRKAQREPKPEPAAAAATSGKRKQTKADWDEED